MRGNRFPCTEFTLVHGGDGVVKFGGLIYQVEKWAILTQEYLSWYSTPQKYSTLEHNDEYAIFPEAMLLMLNNFKQPKCPSIKERMDKLYYIFTLE